ncbi:MAG: hypothetical protein ACRC6G_03140, partial [Deefgea sp.]
MSSNTPQLRSYDLKLQRLNSHKRRATALLVVMFLIMLVAGFYRREYPSLGYVVAFAEAALVGGLADWFAVTALFR